MLKTEYYRKLLETLEWVPRVGDIVAYCPYPDRPAQSNGHTVASVFSVRSGHMHAFINGLNRYVPVEHLKKDFSERGPYARYDPSDS